MNTFLVGLLAAVLSGSIGFFFNRRFWRGNYAATNKGGDFGSPRGGFFVLVSGTLLSMAFFVYAGKYLFPADTIGTALIISMIVGMVAGLVGTINGQNSRRKDGDGGSADSQKK